MLTSFEIAPVAVPKRVNPGGFASHLADPRPSVGAALALQDRCASAR